MGDENTFTFSAAVKDVVVAVGRPDTRNTFNIQRYVRQTIRECQVRQYYRNDLTEDILTAATDNYVWDAVPDTLRLLRTVKYPGDIYPKFILPGEVQKGEERYYYGGPGYFVFNGSGAGDEILIAYYSYAPRFVYYSGLPSDATLNSSTHPPAYYDAITATWYYLDFVNGAWVYVTSLATAAAEEAARAKVSNWLLLNWYDAIIEGASAKLFKGIDDPRAPASFALYKSFQTDIERGEAFESLGY